MQPAANHRLTCTSENKTPPPIFGVGRLRAWLQDGAHLGQEVRCARHRGRLYVLGILTRQGPLTVPQLAGLAQMQRSRLIAVSATCDVSAWSSSSANGASTAARGPRSTAPPTSSRNTCADPINEGQVGVARSYPQAMFIKGAAALLTITAATGCVAACNGGADTSSTSSTTSASKATSPPVTTSTSSATPSVTGGASGMYSLGSSMGSKLAQDAFVAAAGKKAGLSTTETLNFMRQFCTVVATSSSKSQAKAKDDRLLRRYGLTKDRGAAVAAVGIAVVCPDQAAKLNSLR